MKSSTGKSHGTAQWTTAEFLTSNSGAAAHHNAPNNRQENGNGGSVN